MFVAFSAFTNGKILFACKSNQSVNVMSCMDGMRAIAALWIVSGHFALFTMPAIGNTNHGVIADRLSEFFFYCRFSVDTFFVLSSTLAANKMLNERSKSVTDFVFEFLLTVNL